MRGRANQFILPVVITLLALGSGLLHLRLIYILFRGKLWGSLSFGRPPPSAPPRPSGPPPGAPRGGPPKPIPFLSLPLNELFLLNCIGFVVLVFLFWLALRRFGGWVWVADVALIVFTLLTMVGWSRVGKPNPMGYGHLAIGIEFVLVVALLVHLGYLLTRRGATLRAA